MKKLLIILLLLTLNGSLFSPAASAFYDPLSVNNNHFGMHVIDEHDIENAAKLVNSSGGDWGYVKIVIREDDRKIDKWQSIFDQMRKQHVIPIVRLATIPQGPVWRKPRVEDIGSWVDFLSALNWVVENRYVVIFNEPNHAQEWGGEINPGEYGWYLKEFSRRLKEKSPDFFILPAGLDASASNIDGTMDEPTFLNRMHEKEPDVFDFIDGWSSHSYPNPGFVGSPEASGRGSVRTYAWERDYLSRFNVKKLPIFILETGWRHRMGRSIERAYPDTAVVADYFQTAFTYAWNDPQIVAVVPFLLNYQDAPFDHFSWQKFAASDEFYEMYGSVSELSKVAGTPRQHMSAQLTKNTIGEKLVTDSIYTAQVELKNTGQSYISIGDGWRYELTGLPQKFSVFFSGIDRTEPFHTTKTDISVHTPSETGVYNYEIKLYHADTLTSSLSGKLTVVLPPSVLVEAHSWLKGLASGDGYKLIIYNSDEEIVYENDNQRFEKGYADIENLHNVIPDQKYRVVLIKPYYLPRQVITTLSESKTGISFPILLPLDPSNDGKLTFGDFFAFFWRPLATLKLLLAL